MEPMNYETIADFDRREPRGSRKPYVAANMPVDMIDRLKARARTEERPVSAVIRRAVARYLASEQGEAA
jgi:Ribbon-helix-helix protein, copG family